MTTRLVVVGQQDNSNFDDIDTPELDHLRRTRDVALEEANDLLQKFLSIRAQLDEQFAALREQVKALEEQLAPQPEQPRQAANDSYSQSDHRSANRDVEHTPKTEKGENVRRLWLRIAKLCHPDKTKNTYLHKLYLLAKAAYEQDDYFALSELLRQAQDPGAYRAKEVERKRRELEGQANAAVGHLMAMLNSQDWTAYCDWIAGSRDPLIEIYGAALTNRYHALLAEQQRRIMMKHHVSRAYTCTYYTV